MRFAVIYNVQHLSCMHNAQHMGARDLQMQDSMLLDGKLQEYQRAFQAVDTSGNGTLGMTLAGFADGCSFCRLTHPNMWHLMHQVLC